MDGVGNITRISTGGASGRPSAIGPVAPAGRSDHDGARNARGHGEPAETHDKIAHSARVVAAKAKGKPEVEEPREDPPAVVVDPIFDRRVGSAGGGIYVDLVYRNTNFRAARLFGPRGHGEAGTDLAADGVSSADATRAYRVAGAEDESQASVVLTS